MLISKFDNTNVKEFIEEFEKKILFPEQYKKFLMQYNGGQTPNTNFRLNKDASDINGFYGFGKAGEYYNYQLLENTFSFKKWLEDSMIPIADNDFGDYIMIGINNERIYFYYHDRPQKYIEIAKNFQEFISKCKSKKLGHIRTMEERRQGMIDNGLGDKISPEKLVGWQEEIDLYSNIHQEELVL